MAQGYLRGTVTEVFGHLFNLRLDGGIDVICIEVWGMCMGGHNVYLHRVKLPIRLHVSGFVRDGEKHFNVTEMITEMWADHRK